ncbi:MAG: hypothetical protein JNK28_09415 [Burkholderiaceae bacterium]|nr:hypothetical protein [Burkholderiaceae bacterium]
MPAFFLEDDYREHTQFVALAQAALSPSILTRASKARVSGWYRNMPECRGLVGAQVGLDCDEYPYAASEEGGLDGYNQGIVALEPVPIFDNRGAGAKLRLFLPNPACPVPKGAGSKSSFLVVPIVGSPTTFWTCGK